MNRKTFIKNSLPISILGLISASQLKLEGAQKNKILETDDDLTIPLDMYYGEEYPLDYPNEITFNDTVKLILTNDKDNELTVLLYDALKHAIQKNIISIKDNNLTWIKDPISGE